MRIQFIFPVVLWAVVSFAQEPRPIFWNNETDAVNLPAKKEVHYRFETRDSAVLNFDLQLENGGEAKLFYTLVKLPIKKGEKESIVSRNVKMDNKLKMSVDAAGIYELRIKNLGKLPTAFQFKADCDGECGRITVKLSDYIRSLTEGSVEAIGNTLEQKLKEFGIEDPRISSTIHNKDYSKLDTLATVQKLSDLKTIAPLATLKGSPAKPDPKIGGDFHKQLARYKVDAKTAMARIIDKPVPIQWGHHYSNALTQKEWNQSEGLAKILTSLSVGNGSNVTVKQDNKEKKISSPEQLIKYLLDTGHEIRIDLEKVNANFLAFASGDTNILFPTWVKTGIILPSGKELKVPMNHNQIVWKIYGPKVNARVAAFHGIGGVGFTPVTDERPDWAKAEVKNLIDSKEGDTLGILKSIEAAKNLIRLNRCEREKFAKGAPGDGYGLLGVCNDSTSYILSQMKLKAENKPLYPYPMVRPSELNNNDCKQTEADPYASLPHDVDDKNPDKITLLERILAGVPRQADGSLMFQDPELISQVKEAEELLNKWKSSGGVSIDSKTTH